MLSLWRDLRYGLRGMRSNPGFTILAMATLALGIGAATTMFSVIKNVLLSPFPYKDAGRIAAFSIHDLDRARPGGRGALQSAEFLEYQRQSHAQPRFILLVLGVFAGIGLLLVAIGVYSVIAYTVSRQTREIGIRMALGAVRGDVIRMVLRMGLWLIAVGLTIGVGVSLVVNRVIASELWGVSARDPITFAGVAFVVLCAGVAACWFPALRATRVDPNEALRFE